MRRVLIQNFANNIVWKCVKSGDRYQTDVSQEIKQFQRELYEAIVADFPKLKKVDDNPAAQGAAEEENKLIKICLKSVAKTLRVER